MGGEARNTLYVFSVPQSSLSSKLRTISRERSRRIRACFMSSLSMPVSATSWRRVAEPMASIIARTFSSPGTVSTLRRVA